MSLGPFDPSDTPLHKQTARQSPLDPNVSLDDEDEVSIELTSAHDTDRSSKSVIGLGFPPAISQKRPTSSILNAHSHVAQPSPPPPYGPVPSTLAMSTSPLVSVSTPPTQDVETNPLEASPGPNVYGGDEEEEYLRRRRATDAAKALGLAIQCSPSASSLDGSGEEVMDEAEIRKQLRQMRHRLKTRDNGASPCSWT